MSESAAAQAGPAEGVHGADPVDSVLESLDLIAEPHPCGAASRIVRTRSGRSPIAAVVEQGASFRQDRSTISALKSAERDLPIVYIARRESPRREMAVRRLCIHYYLAHPIESDELRLVLEVLTRAASSHAFAHSFERFFTR